MVSSGNCIHLQRQALQWSGRQSVLLGLDGAEARFAGKVRVLDRSIVSSVGKAVEQLNQGILHCPEGYCAVFTAKLQAYYLVFRADKESEALEAHCRIDRQPARRPSPACGHQRLLGTLAIPSSASRANLVPAPATARPSLESRVSSPGAPAKSGSMSFVAQPPAQALTVAASIEEQPLARATGLVTAASQVLLPPPAAVLTEGSSSCHHSPATPKSQVSQFSCSTFAATASDTPDGSVCSSTTTLAPPTACPSPSGSRLLPGDLPPPAALQEAIMALAEVAQSIEVDTSNTGEDHFRQNSAAVQQRPAAPSRPCSPRITSRIPSVGLLGATSPSNGALAWQRAGVTYASNARTIGTVSLGRPRALLASAGCHSRDSNRGTKTSTAGCSISIERGQTRKVDRHGFAWRGLSEEPAETCTSKRLQYDDRLVQSRRLLSRVASPQKHTRTIFTTSRTKLLAAPHDRGR